MSDSLVSLFSSAVSLLIFTLGPWFVILDSKWGTFPSNFIFGNLWSHESKWIFSERLGFCRPASGGTSDPEPLAIKLLAWSCSVHPDCVNSDHNSWKPPSVMNSQYTTLQHSSKLRRASLSSWQGSVHLLLRLQPLAPVRESVFRFPLMPAQSLPSVFSTPCSYQKGRLIYLPGFWLSHHFFFPILNLPYFLVPAQLSILIILNKRVIRDMYSRKVPETKIIT